MTLYSREVERLAAEDAAGAGTETSRRLVRGRVELEFAHDGDARTFLRRQYAEYPFHVCRAQYHDVEQPGLATLYLQSCSGGLYEDDSVLLRIVAGESAECHVSTQSATVVHSMPAGRALQKVELVCRASSYLEYLPDPQILFPHSRCRSEINVAVEGDAVAVVSDSFLAHTPPDAAGSFARYSSAIVVSGGSAGPLAIDRIEIDGESFEDRCPGTSGRFTAQGTLVVASRAPLPRAVTDGLMAIRTDSGEAAIGVSQLPKSAGLLVRMLAADGAALRGAMHVAWSAVRFALKHALPAERRK
jgi:urease accessory protein